MAPAQASANGGTPQTIVVDDTGTPSGSPTPAGSCESPNYNTIQAAVGAATAGDTVQVCEGEYVENVNLNKQLTLNGPNVGIPDGSSPGTRVSEAVIRGEMNVTVGGTVVDGFSFRRLGDVATTSPRLIRSSGVSGQITVQNNRLNLQTSTATGCGAATHGTAAWRVYNNRFLNQRYAGTCSDLYNSRAVWAENAQPIEVDGNWFQNTGQSIYLTGTQPSGSTITNNRFSSLGTAGPFIGVPSDVLIEGNSFEGYGGVYLDSSTDTRIVGNTFAAGNWYALAADDAPGQGLSHSGTVIKNNAILGKYPSGYGDYSGRTIINSGVNSIDATCNWWGQDSGPADGLTGGLVNTGALTLRFLQSAGLDSPCLGSPQPVIDPTTSFKTVGSLVSIQGAGNWEIPEGTGPLTLEYQWEECDFTLCDPEDWNPIEAATEATFRLTDAQIGKRLRAVITATNPGPGGGAATYPALDPFRNPFGPIVAPSSEATQPTPTGENVQVNFPALDNGQQISLDFGCEITEGGTTTVESRDESQVPDAQGFRFGDPPTASTIETTAEYDCSGGKVISVCTTYDVASLPDGIDPKLFHFTGGAWQDATVSWDPTTGVLCGDVTSFSPFAVGRAAVSPANTTLPGINGTAKVGETLNATPGTWSGDQPITYAYQWVRCDSSGTGCSDIAGASTSSYVPGAADAEKRLKVEVRATNDGGSGSALSDPTAAVEADQPLPSGSPNLKVTVTSAKKVRAGKALGASVGIANLEGQPTARTTRSVPAEKLKACLELPKGTSVIIARGAQVRGRTACWSRSSLAVGTSISYRLKIKVFRSASGVRVLRASATAENDVGREVAASGQVKVRILKAKRLKPNTPTG